MRCAGSTTNYRHAVTVVPLPDTGQVRGSVLPRLWTPPLITGPPGDCPCGCALNPSNSFGYLLIEFAEIIGWPFDPWQRFLSIHIGEMLPDGRPRFRQLLIIVARQNGKTVWSRVLVLFWMFIQRKPLIIATHTDRGKAKKSWMKTIEMANAVGWLRAELPRPHQIKQIGEEDFWNIHGAHYQFGAANRRAGRGDTVHGGLLDELREHLTRDALDAVEGAMNAVHDAQLVMISNQGDRRAVVLKSLRDAALAFIQTGVGDPRLGLIEWSAPEGARPTDLAALAMANPDLNNRIGADALLGMAIRAEAAGGDELDRFLIEYMCQAVELLKAAIDLELWKARGPQEGRPRVDLAEHRNKLALFLDVSNDGQHVALAGAALVDGLVHVEIIRGWDSTAEARRELPALVAKLKPRALGWLPGGPAAAIIVELHRPKNRPLKEDGTPARWPPPRVKLIEITSEAAAVCMGFVEQIDSDELRQDGSALALAHVSNAVRLARGDAWVFARKGAGHVSALYAMAGATHIARTLPPPPPPLAVS
jgi:hypothetical protein